MVLCILNRTDICFSIDKVKLILYMALYMAARAEKRTEHGL